MSIYDIFVLEFMYIFRIRSFYACRNMAIGIDSGTVNSCVAAYTHGGVEIIANDQGNRPTPSMVSFANEERLIGDLAKSKLNIIFVNSLNYLNFLFLLFDYNLSFCNFKCNEVPNTK